jgi:hypothetical protein
MQSHVAGFGKKRAVIRNSRSRLKRGRPDIEILSAEFGKEDDMSCSKIKFWKSVGEPTYLIPVSVSERKEGEHPQEPVELLTHRGGRTCHRS